jgi:hypothetical protein
MRSRSSVTVVLVALVALSGCSFLSGPPSNATSTETPTFTGNVSAVEFPDGTTRSGIVDSRTVVNGHVRAIAVSGYQVRSVENISIRGSRVNRRRSVTSSPTGERLLLTIDVPGTSQSGERYLDNRTLYSRTTLDGETDYGINRTEVPFELFHARQTLNQPLVLLLEFGDYEAVGTVTRDGRTLIEYRLTAASLNADRSQNATVDSASGRILVAEDGIVHFGEIDIRGQEAGRPLFVEIEYEVTDSQNATVTPPDWLDDARNETEPTASGS